MKRTAENFLAALLLGGCANPATTIHRAPTIGLALQIAGGGAPTAQQVATIEQTLAPAMKRDGLRFAKDLESADYVVSAVFAPDPVDSAIGHLTVTGIAPSGRSRVNLREIEDKAYHSLGALQAWGASREAPNW